VLIVWHRSSDRLVALVATRSFVRREWFRDVAEVSLRQRARVSLIGRDGQFWFGGEQPASTPLQRLMAETGLPFTISVTSSDPTGDTASYASRRRVWIALFVTVALLLIAGGYLVVRGVSRELEVARLQSEFVAAVSHEFRTPVASMRQLTEILDEGRVPEPERRSRYYGLLRRESERLQRLVEGLLDFRRMESGAAEYRFEVMDPTGVVRDVADEFAGSAGASGRLQTEIAADLPRVRMDREAIARALWNLLDNAAKYSPPATPISLQAGVDNEHVVIRVRDRGPGIAPAEQRRIFRKFVRGESARATGARGTGLGLAMVADIMRAHRGEVQVVSQPGAGATFSLVLPPEGRST
jgi:signal transduction histidine kinase